MDEEKAGYPGTVELESLAATLRRLELDHAYLAAIVEALPVVLAEHVGDRLVIRLAGPEAERRFGGELVGLDVAAIVGRERREAHRDAVGRREPSRSYRGQLRREPMRRADGSEEEIILYVAAGSGDLATGLLFDRDAWDG